MDKVFLILLLITNKNVTGLRNKSITMNTIKAKKHDSSTALALVLS